MHFALPRRRLAAALLCLVCAAGMAKGNETVEAGKNIIVGQTTGQVPSLSVVLLYTSPVEGSDALLAYIHRGAGRVL